MCVCISMWNKHGNRWAVVSTLVHLHVPRQACFRSRRSRQKLNIMRCVTSELIQPLMHFEALTVVFFHRHISKSSLRSRVFALNVHFLSCIRKCCAMFISRNKMNEIYLSYGFCLSFAYVSHIFVVVVVLSCVCNKPHNQFIITLCIGWMHYVKGTQPAKHTQNVKCERPEVKETKRKTTAATWYTSVIERLPQKPFFFNSISRFYQLEIHALYFFSTYSVVAVALFSFLIPFYTFYDCYRFFRYSCCMLSLPSGIVLSW